MVLKKNLNAFNTDMQNFALILLKLLDSLLEYIGLTMFNPSFLKALLHLTTFKLYKLHTLHDRNRNGAVFLMSFCHYNISHDADAQSWLTKWDLGLILWNLKWM